MDKNTNQNNWKKESERLFFELHMSIVDISKQVGRTRKYISEHLKGLPEYQNEKDRRKAESKKKRKIDKREWEKKNRSGIAAKCSENEKAMLKNDHIQAVRELSRERYY